MEEILPLEEEFNYLRVRCTGDGRLMQEMDRQIDEIALVCCCEEGAETKGKALNNCFILVPDITYGHEVWVVTERIRS